MIVDCDHIRDFIREGDIRGICSYYCNEKEWGPYVRDVGAEKRIAAQVVREMDPGQVLDIVGTELARSAPPLSADLRLKVGLASERAEKAFWAAVADYFPEAEGGVKVDCDIDARIIIENWLELKVARKTE